MRRLLVAVLILLAVLAPTSADAAPGDPVGSFDSFSIRLAEPGTPDRMPYIIRGWAADPDIPNQIPELRVYVDGRPYPDYPASREPRPDVRAAYPYAGPENGWLRPIDLGDSRPHHVCVYAMNAGSGSNNTTLGCKTVGLNVGSTAADPKAHLDAATPLTGLIQLRGWAFDPDSQFPTRVRVYIDNSAATDITVGNPRPDVDAAFPGSQPNAGFDFALPVIPGNHRFCVYAGNSGPAGTNNTTVGCATTAVPGVQPWQPGDPRGSVDSLITQHKEEAGNAVEGWAFDPDSSTEIQVHVRALRLGPETGFHYEENIFGTSRARPDVNRVYPEAPPAPGFWDFYEGDARYRQAIPYRCYYAVGVPDGRERFIGCFNLPG